MLPQTNGDSNGQPTVLVVGYDPNPALRNRYEGLVIFKQLYEVRKPHDLPEGIRTVLTRQNLETSERNRIQNLSNSRHAAFVERSESVVVLEQALEDLFLQRPAAPQPSPAPAPASPQAPMDDAPGSAPPPAAEVLSDGTKRIRAVTLRISGSVVAIVQKHMQYPCDAGDESRRLLPLVQAEKPEATEGAVYQAVLSLLKRAGLEVVKSEHSVSPAASTPPTSAGELMTTLQKLIDEHAAFSANHISQLRTLQMRVKHLEGQVQIADALRAENAQLQQTLTRVRDEAKAEIKAAQAEARGLREDLQAIGERIGRTMSRTSTT